MYNDLNFKIPLGSLGDCYDRYSIRIEEMSESITIINQCLELMPSGDVKTNDYKLTNPSRFDIKNSMEALIHHFKLSSECYKIRTGETYIAVEAPKGEFGLYILTNNLNRVYRCRIKAPGFFHLQGLDVMSKGHMIADVVTIGRILTRKSNLIGSVLCFECII